MTSTQFLLEIALGPSGDSKNRFCRKHILWGMLVLLMSSSLATGCAPKLADTQTVELYRQGNLLYQNGKFGESSRIYERIVDRGIRNGYVYYNLGNAYYKQNQIGRSILAYERALRLRPRDADLRNNLALANDRSVDQINNDLPWFGRHALNVVTLNEATVVTSTTGFILSLLLLSYLLIKQTKARSWVRYLSQAISLVFVITIGFTSIKAYNHFAYEEGIILSGSAIVRTSPDGMSDPVFTLHEGAKVRLVEHRGGWRRIKLPDGKNGWLAKEELEGI